MYSDYEKNVNDELYAIKTGKKKTYNKRKVLVTNAAWIENADGSAVCGYVSIGRIYEAYHDSKKCEEW